METLVFVLRGQFAFNVNDNGRVVNFAQQFGIMRVALNDNLATGIRNAFQLGGEVDGFFPGIYGFGGFLADAAHVEELVFGGAKNFGGFAEVFEQLPDAHGADVLNHVQGDQRFPGIHRA